MILAARTLAIQLGLLAHISFRPDVWTNLWTEQQMST
jgi:hypothetical protein